MAYRERRGEGRGTLHPFQRGFPAGSLTEEASTLPLSYIPSPQQGLQKFCLPNSFSTRGVQMVAGEISVLFWHVRVHTCTPTHIHRLLDDICSFSTALRMLPVESNRTVCRAEAMGLCRGDGRRTQGPACLRYLCLYLTLLCESPSLHMVQQLSEETVVETDLGDCDCGWRYLLKWVSKAGPCKS